MKNNNQDFTKRELEILLLISECKKNYEIAHKLFISHHTVESHKAHLKNKLKLNNTNELIIYAVKNIDRIKLLLDTENRKPALFTTKGR